MEQPIKLSDYLNIFQIQAVKLNLTRGLKLSRNYNNTPRNKLTKEQSKKGRKEKKWQSNAYASWIHTLKQLSSLSASRSFLVSRQAIGLQLSILTFMCLKGVFK